MGGWRRWFERPSLASLTASAESAGLRRSLGFGRLLALGLSAVVGAGAFSVLGYAAGAAGAGVLVAIAAVAAACALVALCYAELATMAPVSGSSYAYALAAMGPLPAWLVAWAIALSYVIGNGAVAASLSANLQGALGAAGLRLPHALAAPPSAGGVIDLPAALAVLALTALLIRPVRESATQSALLVLARGAILVVFVALALSAADFGGVARAPVTLPGAFGAAGLAFFAFLGFESVSAAAQEAKDPARDVPRAMLATIALAALLYAILSALLLALLPPGAMATADPLGAALRAHGFVAGAALVNFAGVLATLGVLLVYLLASARVFLPLARRGFAQIHPKHGTPHRLVLLLGLVTAASAALLPLDFLVSLTNEANLLFFAAVALCVPLLRRHAPHAPRPFRAPSWAPYAAALVCFALVATLPWTIHVGFLGWMGLGLMLYKGPTHT